MTEKKPTIVFGRLGQNPELKYTTKSEPVCTFSVAENIDGSDSPVWHRVVVWGKQAESCQVFLKKGNQVFVRGHKNVREFTDRSGNPREYEEIKAYSVGIISD
jgi:single-strand DNA-binding protein